MDEGTLRQAIVLLRAAGAPFAYLHGSQVTGQATSESDIDLAALLPEPAPPAFTLDLPAGVDLIVLNDAPLEIAGRIATQGRLLYEDDEIARVRWEARTRRIYFDEKYRIDRSHREFLQAVRNG